MADLSITAASVRSGLNATKASATTGESGGLAAGDVIYLDGGDLDDDGAPKAKLADANDTKPKAAAAGICLHASANGQPIQYASAADNFISGAAILAGVQYILSNNPGKICPVADLASGWYYTPLFVGKDTTTAILSVAASGLQKA